MASPDQGSRMADDGLDEATRTARRAIDDTAAAGRTAGASAVDDMAATARSIADTMEERQPDLARAARRAADTADDVAEAIRTRSVGDILREVDGFARREPVAFFGGALIAGFALSRFLGASNRGTVARAAQPLRRDGVDPDRTTAAGDRGGVAVNAADLPPSGNSASPLADSLRPATPATPPPVAGGSELARHMDAGAGLRPADRKPAATIGDAGPAVPRTASSPVVTDPAPIPPAGQRPSLKH